MKKILIYMTACLLLVGSLYGATFKAQQGYDIDGTRVMDTVYIKVYGADDVLDTTVSWKPSGGDHLNTDTTIDGRYKLAFTYTSLEEYTISSWGYLDGTCYYNTYNKWPFEATVVATDTTPRGEYWPVGNISDASEIVINGGFEADTVAGTAGGAVPPRGWTEGFGNQTVSGTITNPYDNNKLKGRWRYRLKSTAADTLIMYQYVGKIVPGIYCLSGTIYSFNALRSILFVDRGATISESGWHDSLIAEAAGYYQYRKTVTIYAGGSQSTYIGLCLHANSADDYADFENISFQYIAPLTFVSADTSAAGDSIMTQSDTTACQGATAFTPQDIADAVCDEPLDEHTTGGTLADVINDSLDAKVSAVSATVSDENMGDIADSVQRRMQAVERSLNLVYNGGFEDDSVAGASPPDIWAVAYGVHANNGVVSATADKRVSGRWMHMLKSTGADTVIIYQDLETVPVGIYRLSGTILESGGDSAGIFLDDKDGMPDEASWYESINATAAAYNPFSKIVAITTESKFSIGLYLFANSADDYAYFDDISFQYIAPLWFVAADTLTSGSTISFFDPLSDSVMASALITAINDGVITAASIHNNAITYAKIASDAIMAQHIYVDAIGADELATDAVTEIVGAMAEQTTDTALIKTMALGNPSIYIGTAGSAQYNDTIYAVDTSGTHEAISGVTISVKNQDGVLQGVNKTNSSGCGVIGLDVGTWDVNATCPGYTWATDKEVTVGAARRDTIFGYNLYVDAPSGLQTCVVYGYVYNIIGQVVEDAQVTVSLKGEDLQDTCSNLILTGYQVDTTTNSDGYFAFELIRSSCITPTGTKYLFRSTYPTGRTILSRQITVPDSSTHRITW